MGWLVVLVARSAAADPAASADAVQDCKGLPERSRIAKYEAVGDDAVHVVARSGQRYLVFPHQEGSGCEVYPLARIAAQTSGQFGCGDRAVAVQAPRCAAGSCAVVVAVRGPKDRPVAALRSDFDCDHKVELRPIQLFAGHDSLELVCRASAGAGWTERRVLIEVGAGALTPLYALDTGSFIAPSPAEKAAGAAPSCPVGAIRVEKPGDGAMKAPVLRVIDPRAGELHDGKGTLPARQLVFDPKHHEFRPSGAPDIPVDVDARAGCRR